jgi:hypothetical protein
MIFGDLLNIFQQNIDITNPDDGRNISIDRTGEGRDTSYKTTPMLVVSNLEWVGSKSLEEGTVDLDQMMPFQSEEDMQAALNGQVAAPQVESSQQATRQLAAPKQAVAPTQPEPEQVVEPVVEEDEEPPPCFNDLETVNDSDAECIGGDKNGDVYDPCPFFEACHAALLESQKPKRKSRRPAKKATKTAAAPVPNTDEADALANEMRQALK